MSKTHRDRIRYQRRQLWNEYDRELGWSSHYYQIAQQLGLLQYGRGWVHRPLKKAIRKKIRRVGRVALRSGNYERAFRKWDGQRTIKIGYSR